MNAKSSANKRPRRGKAGLFAILFQLVLVAALFGGVQDSWILVEIRNLSIIVHYLFFQITGDVESAIVAIPLLIIYELVLVCIWAVVFELTAGWLKRKFFQNGVTRRQKIVAVTLFAALGTFLLVRPLVAAHFDRPTPFVPSPNAKALVQANNAFALDLYQRLKERPGNLFFSPCSISAGMGMVYAGTRGTTESQLATALHFNLPQSNLHTAFGELAARLRSMQHWNRLTLLEANSLWYQHDIAFTPAYMKLVQDNYSAELRSVDFSNAPSAAASELAAWVERNTGGRFRGAVKPDFFTPDTRLALCNTIYFKGRWASDFKHNQTKPGPFRISTYETVTVPMMSQMASFKTTHIDVGEDLNLELLELPYYGRDTSMIILLPHQFDGIGNLEHELTEANLHSWLSELDRGTIEETGVTIPRFTFRYDLNLVDELKAMDVSDLFGSNANLSGMELSRLVYVSDVLHQAFIEVNEHGTEAAAMTLGVAATKGMPNRFTADHPFVFLIRDNATGSILFIGRMVNPASS